MRRKAYHAPGMGAPANNTNWIMEDGTQTDRSFYYAEDPNFDHFSIFRTGGINNLPLLSEFDFETSGFITDLTTTQPLTTLPTRQYALENTMNAQEQWEDVTTRALVRGNYIPEGFKDIAETAVFEAGDSYYLFGGTAVSFDQIKTWYDDMINENKNFPWPTAPGGLKDAVVSAVAANFIDFSVAEGRTQSGSHGKLHFYKEGQSYYSVLIRHFDDSLSSNEGFAQGVFNFGRYGVVRNNVYKMTLNKITGPGTPTIPEPEGPDDKEKEYLSTEIEVLP
ncbi:MAG: fimbria major subunit [Bacteroides sp.]|nr:fimbria major subunit [Bacteroides sp.]